MTEAYTPVRWLYSFPEELSQHSWRRLGQPPLLDLTGSLGDLHLGSIWVQVAWVGWKGFLAQVPQEVLGRWEEGIALDPALAFGHSHSGTSLGRAGQAGAGRKLSHR